MIPRLLIVIFATAIGAFNAFALSAPSDKAPVPEWAIIDPKDWSIIQEAMTERALDNLYFGNIRMIWQWKGVEGHFMHLVDTFGKPVKSDLFKAGDHEVIQKAILDENGKLIATRFRLSEKFDGEKLSKLSHLKYMHISKSGSKNASVNLGEFDFPEAIEALSFYDADVTGLHTLHNLKHLKSLRFSGGKLDISGAMELPHLESLSIFDVDNLHSSDIGELISLMPDLRHISIIMTDISSDVLIKVAKTHPMISSLIIDPSRDRTYISNIKFLDYLTNLKELHIYKEDLESLEEFPELPKLEKLTINSTQLSDLTSIHRLPNLKYLDLAGNQIKDMTPLNHLTKLEELTISGNPIKNIQGLKNSKDLLRLNIARVPLTNTKGLEHNHKLEYLELSSHELTQLDNLTHLSELKNLQVNTCNIYDTKGLPAPSSLEILRLDCGSGKYDLSGLKSQPNLREFYCSYCNKRPDLAQSDKALLETIHNRNVEYHDIRHEREKQQRKALKAAYESYKKNHFSKISQAAP